MANSRASSSGSTSYHNELQGEERRRYEAKIAMCGGLDPFTLKATDLKKDWKLWPQLDAGDIIDYLVRKTSYLTRKESLQVVGGSPLPNQRLGEGALSEDHRRRRSRRCFRGKTR